MTAIDMSGDSLYKQNLSEWIYDEKKVVTYHFLSVTLGVHVNLAKQMLFEFYNDELVKNDKSSRKLEVIYYVSGIEPWETQVDLENVQPIKYTSTLCSSDKLQVLKNKLKRIFSVHIYSLRLTESKDTLEKAVKETLLFSTNDSKSGVDFGPFKVLKAQNSIKKRKSVEHNHVEPSMPKNEKSDPKRISDQSEAKNTKIKVEPKAEKETVDVNDSSESKKKEPIPKSAKQENSNSKVKLDDAKKSDLASTGAEAKKGSEAKKKGSSAPDKDRLKNMFAAAAAKPREIKTRRSPSPVEKKVPVSSSRSFVKNANSRKRPAPTTSARQKSNTKEKPAAPQRRRIKVFSSSEEDSDSDKSVADSDEESNPESPIPKRRQIKSDSEKDDSDEDLRVLKKEPETLPEEPIPSLPPCKPGRKRVTKTVTKRVVDEDGYTVTKKEQIVVSESDSDSEEKKPNTHDTTDAAGKVKVNTKELKEISSKSRDHFNSTSKSSSDSNYTTPTSTTKRVSKQQNTGAKSKQASITSFFQKK